MVPGQSREKHVFDRLQPFYFRSFVHVGKHHPFGIGARKRNAWLFPIADHSNDLQMPLPMAQGLGEGTGARYGTPHDQEVDFDVQQLKQLGGIFTILSRQSLVTRPVQCLSEPENESQLRVDYEDSFYGHESGYGPAEQSSIQTIIAFVFMGYN